MKLIGIIKLLQNNKAFLPGISRFFDLYSHFNDWMQITQVLLNRLFASAKSYLSLLADRNHLVLLGRGRESPKHLWYLDYFDLLNFANKCSWTTFKPDFCLM